MWLINLGFVVVCAYFVASMTAQLVAMKLEGDMLVPQFQKIVPLDEPQKSLETDVELYKVVVERNIFNSQDTGQVASGGETVPTPEDDVLPSDGKAVLTTLGIKLISTFSVGAGVDQRSTCVVSGSTAKEADVYTVGDTKQFAPDTKIVRILYDRVEFFNKKRLEYVLLQDFAKMSSVPSRFDTTNKLPPSSEEPAKISEAAAGQFIVDRAEIDAAIANIDKLYTEVRAVPHFKDGAPNGLKLISVKSGSLFSKLGLKRGDILKKINGNELDIKKGLELFNQLKTETQISLEVERKNEIQTMQYEIR